MGFSSFIEGPLLWIVFLLFIIGIIARIVFFFFEIIKSSRDNDYKLRYSFATFGRSLLPFHNAVKKNLSMQLCAIYSTYALLPFPSGYQDTSLYGKNPGLS